MTKYIRLFKKGMYRFCMMFLLILISSGCNVKEIETQTQTETNNQYAVQEPEMTVIDGINYITEQGIKLKVTYPIISKDIADGNLVGTYMVNPVKLGNGLGEKDEMAYIVAGIIEWPSLYNDENIEKLEYTAYNASCIFDYSDMSENKYTKKQMDIKGETKTIYGNDEKSWKLKKTPALNTQKVSSTDLQPYTRSNLKNMNSLFLHKTAKRQLMQQKKLIFSESKFTERMFSFADLSKSAAAAKMTVCIAEFENQTSMRNAMF